VRITIGLEEHVRQGLAALRLSLEEIGWKKEQAVEPADQQTSNDVREFE
jgi:histidinol-phosphate aminotransferase